MLCTPILVAALIPAAAALQGHPGTCARNELQKLIASDASAGDNFGISLSVSKDYAVVGAWGAAHKDIRPGAAYIYRRDDNGTPANGADDFWIEEAKLVASDAGDLDRFGWSVSISGTRAIIGARIHFVPGSGRTGAAYVFRRDDGGTPLDPADDVWVEEAKLLAADGSAWDEFGAAVAIDGDRAVVGAFKDDDACVDPPDSSCDSGSAYIFRLDDGATPDDPTDDAWIQEAKLLPPDAARGDNFGFSVALSGIRCAVSAWLADAAGTDSGAGYIYRRDDQGTPFDGRDDSWQEEAKLMPIDLRAGDNFGVAVSIHGDRAAVGAWLDDEAGSLAGAVYVFKRDSGLPGDYPWFQEAKLFAPDATRGDEFGKSVSISGGLLAVGAFENDDACLGKPDPDCDSGAAYLFRLDDNGTPHEATDEAWIPEVKLLPSDIAPQNFFGRVAIGGDRIIVGSLDHTAGEAAGAAYVFSVTRACTTLKDFADFQRCVSMGQSAVSPACGSFNADGDSDVDVEDFIGFLDTFVGP